MASFQNVVSRLRNYRPGKKDGADSQGLLNNEEASRGAVDIPREASELASNLFTTIIPKKGVEHIVLSQDKIPRKGFPEIEGPSNTDQSDVKISTAEYIEMVGPVLKYQSPTRRSNFVKGILDIKNTSVRDEATRAASKYLDSFDPKDQSKLRKIIDKGIPAIASSLTDGRGESPKPFEGDLPSNIGELKVQLQKLHDYVPTFRKGDLSPSAQLRLAGDIARQFPSAIDRVRREQADLEQNETDGAEQPYRQHSAAPPRQREIVMKLGDLPDRPINNGPDARADLIKSRRVRVNGGHER